MKEAIKLTDTAQAHFKRCLGPAVEAQAIRLWVKRAGCSGYSYQLEVTDKPHDGEERLEINTIPFVIPQQARPFVEALEIDYVEQGISGFIRFHTPKAQGTCGCGESFSFES